MVAGDSERDINLAVQEAIDEIVTYGRGSTLGEIVEQAADWLNPEGVEFDRWDEVTRVVLERFDLLDGTGDDQAIPQEELELAAT